MADYREHIKQAIAALKEEKREVVRELDRKIADLQAVLDGGTLLPAGEKRQATRGQAEKEILEMAAGGGVITAPEIARVRGTTSNAASNVLRRLARKGTLADLGGGRYQKPIIAPRGAQGSLPVEAGGEDSKPREVGES